MAGLPDDMRLGPVALTVAELDRSVRFAQDVLGLHALRRDDHMAAMGVGETELLELHEEPGARPAEREAGLFHVALLHPSRLELARALVRVAGSHWPLTGASDHGVSEALYLRDPDGHGFELYADRPREVWPVPGEGARVEMFTRRLDLDDLIAQLGEEPAPRFSDDALRMGHVHLQVGDVQRAVDFYAGKLGFEEMVRIPSAAFLAKGGYHHYLGLNSWASAGAGPMPPGLASIRWWSVDAPPPDGVDVDDDGLALDPWGIPVRFSATGSCPGH